MPRCRKEIVMADIGTTEAANALADYFGTHLETGHDEGRRLMADALHEQFGISTREARRLIDALEHAGTIHWVVRHVGAAPSGGGSRRRT
jgi:hypothetical protein